MNAVIEALKDALDSAKFNEPAPSLPRITPRSIPDSCVSKMLLEMKRDLISKRYDQSKITASDLDSIWEKLIANSTADGNFHYLTFNQFLTVRAQVSQNQQWIFKASAFAAFPKTQNGSISVRAFHSYAMRMAALIDTYCKLNLYSNAFKGYLTTDELEKYVTDWFEILKINYHHEKMKKYHLIISMRKFRFFHDKSHQDKFNLESIIFSHVLNELIELKDAQSNEVGSNWFSLSSTVRVFSAFTKLDVKRTGMISRKEASGMYGGSLTKIFLDRVFSQVQLFDGQMDFLTYIDFIIAMENTDKPEAVNWIFRALDIKHVGYLDYDIISVFLRDVHSGMMAAGLDPIDRRDMQAEIFDMVNPKEPGKITVQGYSY